MPLKLISEAGHLCMNSNDSPLLRAQHIAVYIKPFRCVYKCSMGGAISVARTAASFIAAGDIFDHHRCMGSLGFHEGNSWRFESCQDIMYDDSVKLYVQDLEVLSV